MRASAGVIGDSSSSSVLLKTSLLSSSNDFLTTPAEETVLARVLPVDGGEVGGSKRVNDLVDRGEGRGLVPPDETLLLIVDVYVIAFNHSVVTR